MATPYLAEIRLIGFGFPPKGWALCNGQLLPINQNQALFSLLGTTYGGDGRVNFALPNLQSRVAIHTGAGFTLGQLGGEQAHTLTAPEMPTHAHVLNGGGSAANQLSPAGGLPADVRSSTLVEHYRASPDVDMGAVLASTGGSQAHVNMQPYLVLNSVIALQGISPSQ